MRMTALEEYQQHRRKLKRIIRHYRLYSGDILCGNKQAKEATKVVEGVTCKRCVKALERSLTEQGLYPAVDPLIFRVCQVCLDYDPFDMEVY